MIYESQLVSATTADLLATGRLTNIPYNGQITMQFSADKADATDRFTLKIQLPNGDVPIDDQLVPGNANTAIGVLDERTLLQFTFPATQGGHFTVGVTKTGGSVLIARFILAP